MRNRLSYYSVILLVGLAMASGLILVVNPFNGGPAGASPAARAPAQASAAVASTNSTSTATSTNAPPSVPITNGFGDDSQPGGTAGGDDHHGSDYPGLGGLTGNSTTTTTTTSTIPYYSQNE